MQNRYEKAVREVIQRFDPHNENRYFQFGSSVRKSYYRDIDIGVVGNGMTQKKLGRLRDAFVDSTIPYKVDVVDFDETNKEFREFVLSHEPIVWIN